MILHYCAVNIILHVYRNSPVDNDSLSFPSSDCARPMRRVKTEHASDTLSPMLSPVQFLALVSCRQLAARELGVSPQLVCDWRKGRRKPSKAILLLATTLWRQQPTRELTLLLRPDGRLP